ncbi:hypothetical protein [uncultured Robinsoniella sp.]|uniref:hypothetical protein n=1 Tax=uncultured Robinsoniella sp. TaxID=904190 RepID=UPI00374FD5D0
MNVPLRNYNYNNYQRNNNKIPWKNIIILIETILLIIITVKYVPTQEILQDLRASVNLDTYLPNGAHNIFYDLNPEDYKFLQDEQAFVEDYSIKNKDIQKLINEKNVEQFKIYKNENAQRLADLQSVTVNEKLDLYVNSEIEVYKAYDKFYDALINEDVDKANEYSETIYKLVTIKMDCLETALKEMNVPYTRTEDKITYTTPSEYLIYNN